MSYCKHDYDLQGETVTLDVSDTFYHEWYVCEHDTCDGTSEAPHESLAVSLCNATQLPNGRWQLVLDFNGLVQLAEQIDYQLDRCRDAYHDEPLVLGRIVGSARSVEKRAKAQIANWRD